MLNARNKKAVKWIGIGHFIVDLYSGFLNPILPFIAANLNISLGLAMSIISISQITSSITQPLFGFLADRCRKRFFLFWGLFMASIFLSSTTIAPNIFSLALCIVFGSMGVAFFHPQASGLTNYFSFSEKVTQKMSIYLIFGTLGFAFGPVVSSCIVDFISLKALSFMSVVGVIFASTMFFFVPKIKEKPPKTMQSNFFHVLKEIFSCQPTKILIFLSIIKAMIQVTFLVLLPFFWKSQGLSPSLIGFFIFMFLVIGSIGTNSSSYIEEKLGTKNTIFLSLLAPFPLTILFVLFCEINFVLSVLLFWVIGFFIMLSTPINITLAQKIMPNHKSTLAGFIGGFSFGVIGLLLPVAGFLAEKISIPYTLIILSFFPFVLGRIVKFLPDEIVKKSSL